MVTAGKRVTNVLLSCAHDNGVGGVQVVLRNLVSRLEQHGRQVHFIYDLPLPHLALVEGTNAWGRRAFYCPMPAAVRNNVVVSLPVFLAYLPITLFHLARVIRREKIDVINCHYLEPYFIHLVVAGRLLGVPVVVSVHGADIDQYEGSSLAHRIACRLVARGASRIVACSKALARQAAEVFPAARHKMTYVHNGLELSQCGVTGETPLLPRPFLLCVCRHVQKKGVDTLLHAFAQVARNDETVSLVLVGSGPLLEENRALAHRLQIEPRVLFVGDVAHAEVPAFLAACALFVLPSRVEPFGLVVLEAAFYKKAIVATRVGGVPEIIADGVNGFLVDADDPTAMAARILALLRDPDLAQQLGQHAHDTLMTRFLWQDRILDYISIYEGRPGSSPFEPAPGHTAAAPLQRA